MTDSPVPSATDAHTLFNRVADGLAPAARGLVAKAFLLASHVLSGARQPDGSPKLAHVVRVAAAVAESGESDGNALAAALLWETMAGNPDAAAHQILPATNSTVLAWCRLLDPLPEALGGQDVYVKRLSRAPRAVRLIRLAAALDEAETGGSRDELVLLAPIAEELAGVPVADRFLAACR